MKLVLIIISLITLSLACALSKMAMNRINRDLSPFAHGITQQMIQKVLSHNQTCLVEVKHHKIISDCLEYFHQMFLNKIARFLPDLKFVINYSDAPRVYKNNCTKSDYWAKCACDKDFKGADSHGFFFRDNYNKQDPIYEQLPIFSPGTISACFSDILMPSHLHVTNRYEAEQPTVRWEDKKFMGIWRGSTTGGEFFTYEPHYSKFHRQKLVGLCQKHPYCDARFFQYYQCAPKICKAMLADYGQKNFMKSQQMYKNKIIIDIDGNTYSARFPAVLRESGSVIIKIALFQDLGYILTEPWKHYIPVRMDLSDFEEKMEWARTHDRQLQNIAKRGHKRAFQVLKQSDFECYMRTLLMKYAALLIKKNCSSNKIDHQISRLINYS